MAVYICQVCDHAYDENKEGVKWEELPNDWICPVCDSPKSLFNLKIDEGGSASSPFDVTGGGISASPDNFIRTSDQLETYMSDIHQMAETGESIIEPMRSRESVISWNDILIKGAQIAKFPLNEDVPVDTKTVIGPKTDQPLIIETPVYISHMSFGALSKESKIALSKGSAAAKTAICSGEGGILPESLGNAYKYIFEYVPNKYSLSDENLQKVDAVELKFGQSAKPGMGGHLPADKVTDEIAAIRGFEAGKDIISPARFNDISNLEDLKGKVAWLREKTGGMPIGIKFAAGNIEADLKAALTAEPDFITIDGRAGGTGAALKAVKDSTSIPTIFALYRARKYLNENDLKDVSLIITGGLRTSADFAKALALGADAVAIATAALIAIGCQQYRICHTGKCPMGITTQDPELRSRFDIEKSACGLANYLKVCTEEIRTFARLTGNYSINDLSPDILCTTNSEISNHTSIEHV